MRRAAVPVAVAVMISGLAACGDDVAGGGAGGGVGGGGTDTEPSRGTSGGAKVQGVGAVLQSAEHGPQLCLGGVMESYPPQCSGPELVGWNWAEMEGAESARGTTWGTYAVTGTWDDGRLTVIKAEAPETVDEPARDSNLRTPCEPPAGGWAVVDRHR
jgi:hypothetical protein